MGRAALPIGDNAPRRLNHGNRGGDVIGLQTRLNHQICLPQGHQTIGVAIHPIARQKHLIAHCLEGETLRDRADFWKSRKEPRLGQSFARACPQDHFALWASQGILTQTAYKTLADIGLINDPEDWACLIQQGNQHPPTGCARHKPARAVNWV